MSDPIIVPAEISETAPAKENFFKKILHQPKKLIIGAGIALTIVAGAVVFAVSRQDEEDFEATFPRENFDEVPADDTIA